MTKTNRLSVNNEAAGTSPSLLFSGICYKLAAEEQKVKYSEVGFLFGLVCVCSTTEKMTRKKVIYPLRGDHTSLPEKVCEIQGSSSIINRSSYVLV